MGILREYLEIIMKIKINDFNFILVLGVLEIWFWFFMFWITLLSKLEMINAYNRRDIFIVYDYLNNWN